jgi:hypothetical protein
MLAHLVLDARKNHMIWHTFFGGMLGACYHIWGENIGILIAEGSAFNNEQLEANQSVLSVAWFACQTMGRRTTFSNTRFGTQTVPHWGFFRLLSATLF